MCRYLQLLRDFLPYEIQKLRMESSPMQLSGIVRSAVEKLETQHLRYRLVIAASDKSEKADRYINRWNAAFIRAVNLFGSRVNPFTDFRSPSYWGVVLIKS